MLFDVAYMAFFLTDLNLSMILFLNRDSVDFCISVIFLISILILQKDEQLIGIILELYFDSWVYKSYLLCQPKCVHVHSIDCIDDVRIAGKRHVVNFLSSGTHVTMAP